MYRVLNSVGVLGLFLLALLGGCAAMMKKAPTVLLETKSHRYQQLGFGEHLWISKATRTETLYANGMVLKRMDGQIILCTQGGQRGAYCAPVPVLDRPPPLPDKKKEDKWQPAPTSSELCPRFTIAMSRDNMNQRAKLLAICNAALIDKEKELFVECLKAAKNDGELARCGELLE